MSIYLKNQGRKQRRAAHEKRSALMGSGVTAGSSIHPVISLFAGITVGLLTRRLFNLKKRQPGTKSKTTSGERSVPIRFNAGFTGTSGAATETTGGHPEDMNGMPAAVEESDASVYDGSDLVNRAI